MKSILKVINIKMLFSLLLINITIISARAQTAFLETGVGNRTGTNSPVAISVDGTNLLTNAIYIGHGTNNYAANTALGVGALVNTTTANQSTAIGFEALKALTGSSNNTAVGSYSLTNTTGAAYSNSAFGNRALSINSAGYQNSALGDAALNRSTGNQNTSLGYAAGYNLTTGDGNTFIGAASGFNTTFATNTTSSNNTALGTSSLNILAGGGSNVALGASALNNLTSGTNNVGIGFQAQAPSATTSNTLTIQNGIFGSTMSSQAGCVLGIGMVPFPSGSTLVPANTISKLHVGGSGTNPIIPSLQLDYVPTGINSVGKYLYIDPTGVVAQATLPSGLSAWNLNGNSGTVDGTNFLGTIDNVPLSFRVNSQNAGRISILDSNTFYGYRAANSNTTGYGNTAIGFESLINNTTGYDNTALGNLADVINFPQVRNATSIGNGAIVDGSDKVRIGNVNVQIIEGQVDWSFPSDGRFKNNVVADEIKGLEFINKLKPVAYNFNTKKFQEFLTKSMIGSEQKKHLNNDFSISMAIRHNGFIAQEVEKAANEVGYNFDGLHKPRNENENYSLSYSQFVVPLVKAVQELSKQNEDLKKEMDELKAMIRASANSEGSIKLTAANETAKLFQNAPNPFKESTTIRYSIPAIAKKAVISITSSAGVTLREFNLKSKTAQIEIAGGQLAAGTYVYSLIVDGVFVDSKQMILTR